MPDPGPENPVYCFFASEAAQLILSRSGANSSGSDFTCCKGHEHQHRLCFGSDVLCSCTRDDAGLCLLCKLSSYPMAAKRVMYISL